MKMTRDILIDSRRSNIKKKALFYRHFQAKGSSSDGTLKRPFNGAVGEIYLLCGSSQAKGQRDMMAFIFIVLLYPFFIWTIYY